MGFFDKIKTFMGGHGVTVVPTEIDGQAPEAVAFSLTGAALQGKFEVRGEKKVVILNHEFKLFAVRKDEEDDSEREVLVCEARHEREPVESGLTWPYTLQPNQPVLDSFCLADIDFDDAVETLGFDSLEEALDDDGFRVFVRVMADVKGTPLDAVKDISIELSIGDVVVVEDDASTLEREAGFRTQETPWAAGSYIARFREMVSALENDSRIEIEECTINPPATAAEIAEAEQVHPMSPAMKAFYEEANGLTLLWSVPSADEDSSTCGRIKLLPIQEAFSSWKDVIWFDEEWDDGSKKAFHPIDFFVEEGCATIHLDGSANPKIYFHSCGEEMDAMELDFAQYLELLLKTRGWWYWQKAFSTDVSQQCYTTEPSTFRAGMRKFFPADYSELFFFRRDYAQEDGVNVDKYTARTEQLRDALTHAGVSFRIVAPEGGTGYITVSIDSTPDNFTKADRALVPLGLDFEFGDDWGAKSIGEVMVSRA